MEQKINAASLASLNDFLDSIKHQKHRETKSIPITFWMRQEETTLETNRAEKKETPITTGNTGNTTTEIQKTNTETTLANQNNHPSSSTTSSAQSTPAEKLIEIHVSLTYQVSSSIHKTRGVLRNKLSSLFRQAKLDDKWRWGSDYEIMQQQMSEDESVSHHPQNPFPSTRRPGGVRVVRNVPEDSLEAYILETRETALELYSNLSDHHINSLFSMANLRLQGFRITFQGKKLGRRRMSASGTDIPPELLNDILKQYVDVLNMSTYFTGPRPLSDVTNTSVYAKAEAYQEQYANKQQAHQTQPHPFSEFSQTDHFSGASSSSAFQSTSSFSQETGPAGMASEPNINASSPPRPHSESVKTNPQVQWMFDQMNANQTGSSPVDSSQPMTAAPRLGTSPTGRPVKSEFATVVTVFDSDAAYSHVDNRGRLLFSLNEKKQAWLQFINDPTLITRARGQAEHYTRLKSYERQVADACGLFDIYCQPSLLLQHLSDKLPHTASTEGTDSSSIKTYDNYISDHPYIQFLQRVHNEAYLFHELKNSFPIYKYLGIRVFEDETSSQDSVTSDPSSAASTSSSSPSSSTSVSIPSSVTVPTNFRIDPSMGLLLVPVTATPRQILEFIKTNGNEAIQLKEVHLRRTSEVNAMSLSVKRRFRLRELLVEDDVTREEMLECCERLLSIFGSLKDNLLSLSIRIGQEYDCDERGIITIPWDWK